MRNLTRQQKKILDQWYNGEKTKGKSFGLWWDVRTDNDFSYELYEKLNDLNPCEIFYQNVNHYIHEKVME